MKRVSDKNENDELRPEYDFSKLPGGVRGKYARRYRAGTNLVRLDPDVAKEFRNEETVNRTLRSLLELAKASTGSTR